MKIDTAGTYTLRYTATDECGNVGTKDCTLNVIAITYRTVLYADGMLIINEKSTDQARNEALHGSAQNVWEAMLEDGSNYVFDSSARLWRNATENLLSVSIGSPIKPVSTAHWFENCYLLASIDLQNMDTSRVTDMNCMFIRCYALLQADLSNFDTRLVTNMGSMFDSCRALESVNLSSFDTSAVTNMGSMFYNCKMLFNIDLSNFSGASVTNISNMFEYCNILRTVDISNFVLNTAGNVNAGGWFSNCKQLTTIYASPLFDYTLLQNSAPFLRMSSELRGGAGTRWSTYNVGIIYAHIDGGSSNPGYFTAKA